MTFSADELVNMTAFELSDGNAVEFMKTVILTELEELTYPAVN